MAIETWAHKVKGGPRNQLWAPRAEQFPHLGNYTLTPVIDKQNFQTTVACLNYTLQTMMPLPG